MLETLLRNLNLFTKKINFYKTEWSDSFLYRLCSSARYWRIWYPWSGSFSLFILLSKFLRVSIPLPWVGSSDPWQFPYPLIHQRGAIPLSILRKRGSHTNHSVRAVKGDCYHENQLDARSTAGSILCESILASTAAPCLRQHTVGLN